MIGGLGDETPRYDMQGLQGAVADIQPPPFRERLTDCLHEASAVPGALVRLAAECRGPDADPEAVERRVEGVQLIYEGLVQLRSLSRAASIEEEFGSDGKLDLLVAGVMVGRGMRLLARTEASDAAVKTVQAFSRHEICRESAPDADDGLALEGAVVHLCLAAGATAAGGRPPDGEHPVRRAFAERFPGTSGVYGPFFHPATVIELERHLTPMPREQLSR